MADSSDVNRVLGHNHATDILFFIAENPGCRKNDVYENVTRNQSTSGRIELLESYGLVEIRHIRNGTTLYPTEKGYRVVRLLNEID